MIWMKKEKKENCRIYIRTVSGMLLGNGKCIWYHYQGSDIKETLPSVIMECDW